MAQPYNYMLDIPNPVDAVSQSMANGFNMAARVDQAQQQREQVELQRQQQAQMNADLLGLANNPSPENYTKVMTVYPQLSENLKRAYDTMDDGKKKTTLSVASQSYAALLNGQPEIAKQVLNDAALAYENSGQKKDAGVIRGYAKLIDNNPTAARTSIGLMMAATDPDKFKDIYSTLGQEGRAEQMQPYEIAKTSAETENIKSGTADNYSQIADRREGRELQKTEMYLNDDRYYAGLDQNEKQFWTKLASDERKTARELEGKPETTPERLTRLEKASGYSNAAAQALDAANNAARLAKLADSNGGAYWDRLMSKVPGTSENTFTKDVETLKSQVFLTQVEQMRGLGALTESEGAALKSSIASLDMNQGVNAFKSNLNKISLVLNRAAKKAEKNAELYATKGRGYSEEVVKAAKQRGISPAEMQDLANDLGW